jgi:ribosome-associated heat shock protein Hsp15
MHGENGNEETRIDKWLWAARFFKTRSLAAEAVNGGKVEVNGARAKPSRAVRPGDSLNIRRPYEWTVCQAVAKRRGPRACQLFCKRRKKAYARRSRSRDLKLERPPEFDHSGRPSKKDRRAINRFTKKEW